MQERKTVPITLTNYESGEMVLAQDGLQVRLVRDLSNRLIMAARMHTVAEFIEKLPTLITEPAILQAIQSAFEGKSSTERWNVKEKFARLQTLAKGYESPKPDQIADTVTL